MTFTPPHLTLVSSSPAPQRLPAGSDEFRALGVVSVNGQKITCGTLIGDCHVLTSSDVVKQRTAKYTFAVTLRASIATRMMRLWEGHVSATFGQFALIRLSSPVPSSLAKPAKLPGCSIRQSNSSSQLFVVGFGATFAERGWTLAEPSRAISKSTASRRVILETEDCPDFVLGGQVFDMDGSGLRVVAILEGWAGHVAAATRLTKQDVAAMNEQIARDSRRPRCVHAFEGEIGCLK